MQVQVQMQIQARMQVQMQVQALGTPGYSARVTANCSSLP